MPRSMVDHTRSLECQSCNRTFSQKSSLVRHLKLCSRPRPASLRQKSCNQCAAAKGKCDLQRPSCSRCLGRETPCAYAADSESAVGLPVHRPSSTEQDSPSPTNGVMGGATLTLPWDSQPNFFNDTSISASIGSSLDSSIDSLICADTSDLTGLDDQWMLSLLPLIDTTPVLAAHSMNLILRVLRTWPRMMAKGFHLPPMFHPVLNTSKDLPKPLANCFTLAKMWDGQFKDSTSIVQATIEQEMDRLLNEYQSYDETNLVAALQALAIYNIMLLFPSKDQISIPALAPSILTNIQQVVYRALHTGLVLQEETDHTLPNYEAWIHVNSKRRAVFTLYVLHWSYTVYHRLPSPNCEEIGYIPAPAAKFLWNAATEEQWESLYKRWLVAWHDGLYMLHEVTFIKPGVMMERRAQMWLEDTDELGLLFMSIINTTEREPEFDYPRGKIHTGTSA